MSTTGAKAPTAAQTIAEDPWLDDTWVNPANIYGTGEASVTAATFDAGDQTYVLKAYGFDFSAIPDGAVIDGVICVVNARYATALASIDLMQLLDISRAKVGTNQCATPVALTTSAANYTKGSSTDLWGNDLTPAWLKDADFGVAIGCLAGGSGNNNVDVYIDSVTLEVYYHVPFTETLVSIGISAASLIALQTFVNILSDAIQSSDSITDVKNSVESLLSQIVSQSALSDKQNYIQSLLSQISSVSSIQDFKALTENLSATAISQSTIQDYQIFVNIVLTTIQSSDFLTEAQTYLEGLVSQISSQSAAAAIQGYLESLITIASSTASIIDFKAYVETLSTLAHSSDQISDFAAYVQQLQSVAISLSSVVDVFQGSGAYTESLLSTIISLSSVQEVRNLVENLTSIIQSHSSLEEGDPLIEQLQSLIMSQAGVYDYYKKPSMAESTIQFELSRRNDFEMAPIFPMMRLAGGMEIITGDGKQIVTGDGKIIVTGGFGLGPSGGGYISCIGFVMADRPSAFLIERRK